MKKSVRIARNIVLPLALFLALLPLLISEAASWGLKYFLEQRGANGVRVDELWFNPYTARLELQDLVYEFKSEKYHLQRIAAKLSLSDLISHKIRVQNLLVEGLPVVLRQLDQSLSINGLELPVSSPAAGEPPPEDGGGIDEWQFAIDELVLEAVTLDIKLASLETRLQIDHVSIDDFDSSVQTPAPLRLDIELQELHLPDDPGFSLSTRLTLESGLHFGHQASGWELAGESSIALRDIRLSADNLNLSTERLTLSVDIEALLAEKIDLAIIAESELLEARLQQPQQSDTSGLKLASRLKLNTEAHLVRQDAGWQLAGVTSLDVNDTRLDIENLAVHTDSVSLAADLQALLADQVDYQVTAASELNNLQLQAAGVDRPLLTLGNLQLKDAHLNSNAAQAVAVSAITLDKLSLLAAGSDGAPAMVDSAAIRIEDIQAQLPEDSAPLSASIKRLAMPSGDFYLLRESGGELPQLQSLRSAFPSSADPATAEPSDTAATQPDTGAPADVRVAEISIGPGVQVNIEDRGVTPALKETLTFDEFRLADVFMDGRAPAKLLAKLGLSHDASLEISGAINPLSLDADLLLDLSQYQLLQVSGYAQLATGYALEAGTISLDSTIKIDQQQMDLKNSILIDQIHLRTASKDKAESYAKKISMPLDQALDLLRNKKGEIKLKLPVKGRLDDPDIQLDQIINKALGGALKAASISALKFMLQPYSTVIAVAQFAGDQLSQLRLEPIKYSPGSSELTAEAQGYAVKIAGILKDRDGVKLKLCGVTNGADAEALKLAAQPTQPTKPTQPGSETAVESTPAPALSPEQLADQLYELAEKRSSGLRGYLINAQQVTKSQLLVCLPDHRDDDKAVAGVELLL